MRLPAVDEPMATRGWKPSAGAMLRAKRTATAESLRSVQITVRGVSLNQPGRAARDSGRGITDIPPGVCARAAATPNESTAIN